MACSIICVVSLASSQADRMKPMGTTMTTPAKASSNSQRVEAAEEGWEEVARFSMMRRA